MFRGLWPRRIGAILILTLFAGCVTAPAPLEEYTLARAALESARAVEAAKHSPGFWGQAEEAYRKAKILYREREYDQARIQFNRAKLAAEKAENSARLIRNQNGEVL